MSASKNSHHLVYGIHAVEALLSRSSGRVEALICQSGKQNPRVLKLIAQAKELGIPYEETDRESLDRLTGGNHQGVVARSGARQEWSEKDLSSLLHDADQPLILILDGVTDPHNLGACLRSAEAAGVSLVIAPKNKSAPLNDVVSKVSCGASETLPLVYVTNLARTMRWLQDQGVWLTGTAVDAGQSLYSADLSGARALVMGSEGKGIRRLTREHCDELVYIPMAGSMSSLNVSVATGVCLFEALRQRSAKING